MKHLLVITLAALASCNSPKSSEQQGSKFANDTEKSVSTAPQVVQKKWKADEATKKNVAAMMQIVADSTYTDAAKRVQLYTNLRARIDTLVQQCTMKGPEHDALHVWLEKVLEDLKELKVENPEHRKVYTTLKKDVGSFYQSFE